MLNTYYTQYLCTYWASTLTELPSVVSILPVLLFNFHTPPVGRGEEERLTLGTEGFDTVVCFHSASAEEAEIGWSQGLADQPF